MTITTRTGKGAPLSYAEMDANLTQFDLKTADGWADIVSEFYTRGGPASPGVSQFIGGIYLLEFSDTDTLEAFTNVHIPHAYKPGTMMYPHIHFVAEAAQGAGIPGTDIEVDGMVMCRVFREPTHPNDTFVGSVWAITADMHIEVDRHSTPNRAPNFYA